ncbi:MAG: HDOD domain-containing protein [Planctomycetes bacterium]|nr:HDOD domain-containing protein [Planctomycetota bacterium]
MKIRALLQREDVGIGEVSIALSKDPPLAIKVLRIANSVQIGASEPKTSVQAATSMLGLRGVASVVLRAGLIAPFEHLKDADGFSLKDLWCHSILVGQIAENIARACRHRGYDMMPQEYYTCGLVHDIGKIILYDNFGDEFLHVVREKPADVSDIQAESAAFLGLNHAEIGAMAAELWLLPRPVIDVVKFHHRPLDPGSTPEVVTVVTCADEIADLVEAYPDGKPRDLVAKLRTVPPGCTQEMLIKAVSLALVLRPTIEV